MVIIQRVRVRWTATGRGAPHANLRRGLDRPVALPVPLPDDDVVIHDVFADEVDGYTRHDQVLMGGDKQAREIGLWITGAGVALTVERLPGWAAYPSPGASSRLFALQPGQVGRYRANFRFTFTSCACNPSWYYESWTIHVSNGSVAADRFTHGEPDRDVDERVHLYGGPRRPAGAVGRPPSR